MASKAERIAVITLNVVLGLSAVVILIWMASIHWADITGTTVGAIFVGLAGIQVALSVAWFRLFADGQRTALFKSGGSIGDEQEVVKRSLLNVADTDVDYSDEKLKTDKTVSV